MCAWADLLCLVRLCGYGFGPSAEVWGQGLDVNLGAISLDLMRGRLGAGEGCGVV
jgi:hypothetical protein